MKTKFLNIFLMLVVGIAGLNPILCQADALPSAPTGLCVEGDDGKKSCGVGVSGGLSFDASFPVLSWNEVVDAYNYNLEIIEITSGEIQRVNIKTDKLEFTDTIFTTPNEYKWQVKSCDSFGNCGGASSWCYFGIGKLGKPEIKAFEDASDVSLTPKLEWKSVSGADKYEWVVEDTDGIVAEGRTSYLFKTISDSDSLDINTDYEWHVYADTDNGLIKSESSEAVEFKTTNGLAQPKLLSPTNGDVFDTSSPILRWESVSGADKYYWKIMNIDDTLKYEGNTISNSASGFALTGTYKWKVQAKTNSGIDSDWSSYFTFTSGGAEPICPIEGQSDPYNQCEGNICKEIHGACGVTQCSTDAECVSPPADDPSVTPPVGGECDVDRDCESGEDCFCANPVKAIKGLCAPAGSVVICPPTTHGTFADLVNSIIDFIYTIALVFAPIMFIVAGFTYITSIGEPAKVKKAYDIAFWTAVGLLIVLLSKGIIIVIQDVLG